MLFPILEGLFSVRRAPVTWALFFMQATVFLFLGKESIESNRQLNKIMKDDVFMGVQGRLFAQYVTDRPAGYAEVILKLAKKSIEGEDSEHDKLLGSLAMRDVSFMEHAKSYQFIGDRVEISRWQKTFRDLLRVQEAHPSNNLGISAGNQEPLQWITYFFTHSGISHFLGNMFFLLIFGSMIEASLGGLQVLLVFVLSGVVGALAFLFLSGSTAAPLIGASGAVSGLMVLFGLQFGRRPVRFFFAVLPSARFVGIVYLPAWVVNVMFVSSDLAGFWGSLEDFGGIAYAAHLGGEFAGGLTAMGLYLAARASGLKLEVARDAQPVIGRPISLFELLELRPRPKSIAEIRSKASAQGVLSHDSRFKKLK